MMQRPPAIPTCVLLCALATGCGRVSQSQEPITDYVFISQFLGDKSYEEGPTVCSVARGRQHLHLLTHDTERTCRPSEYSGSTHVSHAFSDPPAWIELLSYSATTEHPLAPVTKVRSHGDWSVGLMPTYGLFIEALTDTREVETIAQIPLDTSALLRDVAVGFTGQGVVAAAATGGSSLVVVDLERLSSEDSVVELPLGSEVTSVALSGTLASVIVDDALVLVDVTDPASPTELGRLSSPVAAVQGVAHQDGVAWLAADGRLFTANITNPDSPSWIDDEGVESAVAGIHLIHDGYLFQAPGFNEPLAITSLRDPQQPEPFWGMMGGNGVFDVTAAGSVLYLAVGSGGVHSWGPERDYEDIFR